jgi:hypothetical protein
VPGIQRRSGLSARFGTSGPDSFQKRGVRPEVCGSRVRRLIENKFKVM